MDEIYRMLGREHQADLDREARKRGLATAVRASRPARMGAPAKLRRRRWIGFVPSRLAAFFR